MPSATRCRVTVGYADGRPAHEDDESELHLDGSALLLSYWDERGVVLYAGDESRAEPGRWELVARSRPRRCSLRREDPRTFAGAWEEGEERGTLRVELAADAAGQTR